MIARELLGTAQVPGGEELKLYRHDRDFMIVLGHNELMSTRKWGSEEALATMSIERIKGAKRPHLLIGGYGMGFTLRAALKALQSPPKPAPTTRICCFMICSRIYVVMNDLEVSAPSPARLSSRPLWNSCYSGKLRRTLLHGVRGIVRWSGGYIPRYRRNLPGRFQRGWRRAVSMHASRRSASNGLGRQASGAGTASG